MLKSEEIKKTKATYEEIQTYLKTNIQGFLHKLSSLPSLKILDISNNKIHFFDIDPFLIQKTNGFRNLTKLDISNNIIDEELGIILVMNLPSIKAIIFDGNPLLRNKKNLEKIEYEIFRNKNILFYENDNTKHLRFNSVNKIKASNKYFKPLKINFSSTRKLLKLKHKFNVENEQKSLEVNYNMEEKIIPEFNIIAPFINSRKEDSAETSIKGSSFFLTNEPNNSKGSNLTKFKSYSNEDNNYLEFLRFAKICLGEEKHYNNIIPIRQAYTKLRLVLTNKISERNEEINTSKHYLQKTILGEIRSQEYIPTKDNLQNEFRFLSKFHNINKSSSSNNLPEIYNNSIDIR